MSHVDRSARVAKCHQHRHRHHSASVCSPKMASFKITNTLKTVSLLLLFSIHSLQAQELRPPRITEHPSSVIVKNKHEPVRLECKADGNPTPKIEWYKDNDKVQMTSNRLSIGDSIMFLHITKKDIGHYYCLARNEIGKVKSRNASLEIAFLREEFRLMPKNVQVSVGEQAVFECLPPKGHPEPAISWIHEESTLDLGPNSRFQLDGSNLVINDVALADQGSYRCIAQNLIGFRDSPPAILKVLVRPYFIRAPEDLTSMAGDDVIFHCKVGGDPVPTITWKREDGKPLHSRAQILDGKSLKITNVRTADEGVYICEVENNAGVISSSATLSVTSLPNFLSAPKSVQVSAGNVARFECLVDGNPKPLTFWSKEGTQVLIFAGESHGRFQVDYEGTLTINNVEKDDKGFYVCSSVSRVGSATSRAKLSVLVPAEIPPPIIRFGAANQTLPEFTKAFLPCEVNSPGVDIKWFFMRTEIQNDGKFTITPGSLEIHNIQKSDSGVYTCVVKSPSGVTTWSSRLLVESPRNPNIIFYKMSDFSMLPEPPTKVILLNATETTLTVMWQRTGSSGASLHVGSMLEYYSPDIKSGWTEAGRRIISDTFVVKNLRPNTRYVFIVRAENKHGLGEPSPISEEFTTLESYSAGSTAEMDASRIRNLLQDVQVRLRDVRTISSTSVKLVWSVQGNLDLIEGFYIRFQKANNQLDTEKFNMVTVFGGSQSSYILTDLKKYSNYNLFVVPFHKTIEGRPSNLLSVRTFEDAPSQPPSSVTVKALNTSSALVEWAPPPDDGRNGALLGYHLQIFENQTHLYANLTLDSSYNSMVLYNLSLTAYYTVRALAFTAMGNGPFSTPLSFQLEHSLKNPPPTSGVSLAPNSANPLAQTWFYVFVAVLLTILVLVAVKFLFVYTKRNKSNASIFDKAGAISAGYNEPFPKYTSSDSHSSKYSAYSEANEYAEVNDLKNYSNSDHKTSPYAMTPLIEKQSTISGPHRAQYSQGQRAHYFVAGEDRATESLLKNKTNPYTGNMSRNIVYERQQQQQQQPEEENEYELTNDDFVKFDDPSKYDRSSIINQSRRSVRPTFFDSAGAGMHSKLSTFESAPGPTPSTRIIMNPCDSPFDMMSSTGRSDSFGAPNDVNHYHVSEDLCKLSSTGSSVSSYNSGGVKKPYPRYQISMNGNSTNENDTSTYHSSNLQNRIGASLSLREQISSTNKPKMPVHQQLSNTSANAKNKRTNRPVIDLMTSSDCPM